MLSWVMSIGTRWCWDFVRGDEHNWSLNYTELGDSRLQIGKLEID